MIENNLQLRISKTRLREFGTVLAALEQDDLPEMAKTVRRSALSSLMQELEEDIQAFEQLRGSHTEILNLDELEELPQQLIRARVSAGLTQAALAQRVGLKTQQIQRYETSQYASASLTRVIEIARAIRSA
jgi:ribosome-binding protein aMBF1 (putative translation factor)